MLRDEIGGTGLPVGELGMLVDVPPPGHDFAGDLRGSGVDFRVETPVLSVERGS